MDKLILWSDLHGGLYKNMCPTTDDGLTTRVHDTLCVLDQILARVQLIRNVGAVEKVYTVFLGDLFERRGVIEVNLYSEIYDKVRKLCQISETYFMSGNHDIVGIPEYGAHNWSILDGLRGVAKDVFNKPLMAHVLNDKVCLTFIPFSRNTREVKDAIRIALESDVSEKRILLLHQGIHGAVTGPVNYVPDEELTEEDVKGYDLVFFGHYHKPQELKGGAVCVGSSIIQDFGEADENKRFVEIDLDTLDWKSYALQDKAFINIRINSLEELEGRNRPSVFVDGYVKVVCTDPSISEEAILKRVKSIQTTVSYDVQPDVLQERVESPNLETPRILVEQFVNYIHDHPDMKHQEVLEKYGKDTVLSVGQSILEAVDAIPKT